MTDTNTTSADESAINELRAEINALKAKNAELLTEKKNAKADADAAREAAEQAAEEKALASNDLETIKATLTKQFEKQRTKLTAERDAATQQLNTLLIDNGIQSALVENNVAAHMHEPLKAMFKAQAKLEGGNAMLGDVDLSEGLKAYFAGDNGKHFVAAPVNSGGNAVGSKVAATSHGFTKENFNARRAEWMMLEKSNPEEARAIKESLDPQS